LIGYSTSDDPIATIGVVDPIDASDDDDGGGLDAFAPDVGSDGGVGSSYDSEDDGGSDDGFYDAPEDPESQEDDVVTFEDVAEPEDVDSEAALDALSDDPNLNDTVDGSTTVNPEDGGTYTNVGGDDADSAEWAATDDVLDVNQSSDDQTEDAPDNTPSQPENTSSEQSPTEAVEERVGQLLASMEADSEEAAAVPVPVDGSSGLTATGAAVTVAGAGALYLAFAGGS
jgi:hypothetical protein